MRLATRTFALAFLLVVAGASSRASAQLATPPTGADKTSARLYDSPGQNSQSPSAADFPYGVGYAPRWEPASGVHWRKNARVEYYSRPPAPSWRWFTGHGCTYERGVQYGTGYPQLQYFGYLPWYYTQDSK